MSLIAPYSTIFYIADGTTRTYSYNFEPINAQFISADVKHTDGTITYDVPVTVDAEPDGRLIGTITFDPENTPESGAIILIQRTTPQEQATEYSRSIRFNPKNIETSFDLVVAMIQELSNKVNQNTLGLNIFQTQPFALDLMKEQYNGATLEIDYTGKLLKAGLHFKIESGNLNVSTDGQSWIMMPKSTNVVELKQVPTSNPDIKELQYRVGDIWYSSGASIAPIAEEALEKANQAIEMATTAIQTSTEAESLATEANENAEIALNTARTANTKSDTAVSTANTALTTANTAITTAQRAENKADNAVQTAESADEKADQAVETAESADNKADQAITTATNADTKATTALSNSQTALSNSQQAITTANAASQAATQAVNTANTALSTAQSADTKSDSAVATANAADTKSDSAVATASAADTKATNAVQTAGEAKTIAEGIEGKADQAIATANAASTTATNAYNKAVEAEQAVASKADEADLQAHVSDTDNPHSVTKAQVGLGNADNTSDADKPISTATQTALNDKQDIISDLSTIRSNASAGKSASDTIATYGNIVTHNVAEFATAAQGSLADSAIQPDDNISELTNDADYQSGSQVTASISAHNTSNTAHSDIRAEIDNKSSVSVSATGTATEEIQYITVDGVEKKIAGGSGGTSDFDILTNRPSYNGTVMTHSTNIPEVKTATWDGKQDAISDLATIRSGAAAGATAVQPSSLSTVAITGSYNDLEDTPTIPAAQVPADWNATTGVARILNKPTIPTVPTNVSAFTNDAGYVTSAYHDSTKQDVATAVNYNNISNCITEIPQDIKLELNNGTLTLKAGSKVYVPNGAGVFDIRNITADQTLTQTTNGQYLLLARQNMSIWASLTSAATSGTTPPAGTGTFYNTTTNSIDWYDNGTYNERHYSFPFALITVSNGAITSIDQVFNGFGYIGSTAFLLPNVKVLVPNGRNTDGSLKTSSYTTNSVKIRTANPTYTGDFDYAINTNLELDGRIPNSYHYDEQINYFLDNSGNKLFFATIARAHMTNGNTDSFTPKTAFHALDYNDTEYIAHNAMPSNRSVELTVGTSGSTYTAPADGYFTFTGQTTSSTNLAYGIINTTSRNIGTLFRINANGVVFRAFTMVSKGQTAQIIYESALTNAHVFFVYANGAQ